MDYPDRHNYRIVIDLKPALDEKTLDKRILRDFDENNNKDFINSLSKLLPNKIIPVIVKLSGIEAIVTSGGVSVREIEPKTMRSKLIDNLFFAGEVIDVDAYTGGFNLQIAFSTGYVCGQNM